MSKEPAIKLEANGLAPVLSYEVPEGTTYSGRNFIDLQFPESYFKPTAKDAAPAALLAATRSASQQQIQQLGLDPSEVEQMERAGKRLSVYTTLYGALAYDYVDATPERAMPLASTTSELARGKRGIVTQAIELDPDPNDPLRAAGTMVIVSITSPAAGATITGPHTGAVFNVTGSAMLLYAGGTIASVQVKLGNAPYQQAVLDGSTWTLANATATASGELTIVATVTDRLGNQASRSITVNIALAAEPDSNPPAVKILSPTSGLMLSANGSGVAELKVEGTAGDDRAMARVELSVDSGPAILVDTGDGWNTWSKTISLGPGSHTISARAVDGAGNSGYDTITVLVDADAPTIAILSPLGNHEVFGTELTGAMVEVTGTAQDAGGIARVELSLDSNPVAIQAEPTSLGDWSQWRGSLLVRDSGLHVIKARVVDRAGNFTEAVVPVLVTITPETVSRVKRLIIAEQYQLSSYLGNYGAGRTLKTFSLLPGEKTKISVRTYSQDETTSKSASSILDSFTETSAEDFQKSMETEQSDQTAYKESFNYKVGVQAKASWGFGSAAATAEVSGGTNGAREEFAKNITNAVQKHAASASSKRDVQINTSYETKSTTSEENSIVRDIQNINVSRTLNFVFRQMNQEFITLLHLTDVRIGFFELKSVIVDGVEDEVPVYREATLPQLDALLMDVIVPEKHAEVRAAILHQLMHIFDYQDRHHCFVEDVVMKDAQGNDIPYSNYLRVKKDYQSQYTDVSGNHITVNGIIIAANKHVLRTEGVVVEAILGQGNALDDYSENLQKEAIQAKKLSNDLLIKQIKRESLAQQIVTDVRSDRADVYAKVFAAPAEATTSTTEAAAEPANG